MSSFTHAPAAMVRAQVCGRAHHTQRAPPRRGAALRGAAHDPERPSRTLVCALPCGETAIPRR